MDRANRVACAALFALLCLPFGLVEARTVQECTKLYRQKQYAQAGKCFHDLANAMGNLTRAPALKKYEKGRWLRNATTSYIKAAKRSRGLKAAGFYETILRITIQYVKEELYENNARKIELRDRIRRLLRQTNLSRLEIESNNPSAKMCLTGGGKTECQNGATWSKLLPPMLYQLVVTYPDGSTQQRQVRMRTGLQLALSVFPVKSKVKLEIVSQHPTAKLTLTGATFDGKKRFSGNQWTLQVAPGTYNLQLKYPGVPAFSKVIVVRVGKDKKVVYRPPSSTLQINASPLGADVYIDGIKRGKAPLQLLVIDGEREITLRKGCHEVQTKKVSIKPQERKTIEFQLKPERIYLNWLAAKKSSNTIRTLSFVGLLGGLAVGGLSAGSYVAALLARDNATRQQESYLSTRTNPEQYLDAYRSAAAENNTWMAVGIATTGVGGAAVLLGLVGLLSPQPAPASSLRCRVPLSL